MPLPSLPFAPSAAGFGSNPITLADFRDTRGGLPMAREDALDAQARVSVTWELDASDYEDFITFFQDTLEDGTLPFTTTLPFDYSSPIPYDAIFVPGSLRLANINANEYTLDASLEVTPQNDPDIDDLILDTVESLGSPSIFSEYLADLAHLVNVTLPDTFG